MGHVISHEGPKPDPDKVRAVTDMPRPTSKQETLSLLGFINYLAKFLPRLSEVAQPQTFDDCKCLLHVVTSA